MVVNCRLGVEGEPVFDAFAIRKRPLVVNVPVHVPPEPIPEIVPTAAPVVTRPDGTPVLAGVHVPEAESHISILTD